jgi:hypothetical protein
LFHKEKKNHFIPCHFGPFGYVLAKNVKWCIICDTIHLLNLSLPRKWKEKKSKKYHIYLQQ